MYFTSESFQPGESAYFTLLFYVYILHWKTKKETNTKHVSSILYWWSQLGLIMLYICNILGRSWWLSVVCSLILRQLFLRSTRWWHDAISRQNMDHLSGKVFINNKSVSRRDLKSCLPVKRYFLYGQFSTCKFYEWSKCATAGTLEFPFFSSVISANCQFLCP